MKEFWKATGVRCLRTFLVTILACWSSDQLITTVDWRYTLIASVSATVYIFILCVLAGLPEVPIEQPEFDTEAFMLAGHDESEDEEIEGDDEVGETEDA